MREKIKFILMSLELDYKNVHCTLNYNNAFELLVATQLAAQCTDERVNRVTEMMFKEINTPKQFAEIDQNKLEAYIFSTGFYRNKARNIIAASKVILEEHDGTIPKDIEKLTSLPGVGRKTANVILGEIYNIAGVVVDTHVTRISNRLGLTTNKDAVKIEKDLMKIIPKSSWTKFGHQLVFHGRKVCKSRKPECTICKLSKYCNYYLKNKKRE